MNNSVLDCEIGKGENKKFSKKNLQIGAECRLTLSDAYSFVKHSIPVSLAPASYEAMEKSYQFLKSQVDARIPVYGVNTNFGDQVRHIDAYLHDENAELYYQSILTRQSDIVKSLTCSLGEPASLEFVKLTMLLRAHCLAQGYSAVTSTLIEGMIDFINAGIVPVVRRYGSIGASGDLIPLATIASAYIGEDIDVMYQGIIMSAPKAIFKANLKSIPLPMRDGLALINGTSFMTAIAGLSLYTMNRLFKQMLFAIGMSLESMHVISSAYQPIVHQLKHHRGEEAVNQFLLNFWNGSQLLSDLEKIRSQTTAKSAAMTTNKSIQDYYSLRAVPQGFGTFEENLAKANVWVENEMNSINDNPLIDVTNNKIFHNANFMGYYITDACDILKANISQASAWIHALMANLVHPSKNVGMPANLALDPSKNGFRALQLLAASIAVQNRKLAQAQSSYHLPTEGDNQDVSSLGTHAAFDFAESVNNLERLTAILFITSAQALEFRGLEKAGKKSQQIVGIIREKIPALKDCRVMENDLLNMIKLLQEEKI